MFLSSSRTDPANPEAGLGSPGELLTEMLSNGVPRESAARERTGGSMYRVFLACLVVLVPVYAACSLTWPMARDQGTFAWVGDTICRGGLPYRDAWEHKGPASHYTYAMTQALFGRNQWGIRLFDLIVLAAGMAGLWKLGAAFSGRLAGVIAVLAYFLVYGGMGYWHTSQPDGWVGAFQILAVAALLVPMRGGPWVPLLIVGFITGITSLYKPNYAIFLIIVLPYAWKHAGRIGARLIAMGLASFAAFAAPMVLTVAYFWHRGALPDMVEAVVGFNKAGHLAMESRSLFGHLSEIAQFYFGIGFRTVNVWYHGWFLLHNNLPTRVGLLSILAILGFYVMWRRDKVWFSTVLLWSIVTTLEVVAQHRYYPYHWIPTFGPLMLAAAIGAVRIREAVMDGGTAVGESVSSFFRRPGARLAGFVLGAVLFQPIWVPLAYQFTPWVKLLLVQRSWDKYYKQFGQYGGTYFSFLAEKQAAEYLYAHSSPSDRVLVWGFDPTIYYLADRQTPTRFGFNYPLKGLLKTPYQEKWREELMETMRRTPPLYVIQREGASDFDDLDEFLCTHYTREATVERYEILRLNGPEQEGVEAAGPAAHE